MMQVGFLDDEDRRGNEQDARNEKGKKVKNASHDPHHISAGFIRSICDGLIRARSISDIFRIRVNLSVQALNSSTAP